MKNPILFTQGIVALVLAIIAGVSVPLTHLSSGGAAGIVILAVIFAILGVVALVVWAKKSRA